MFFTQLKIIIFLMSFINLMVLTGDKIVRSYYIKNKKTK